MHHHKALGTIWALLVISFIGCSSVNQPPLELETTSTQVTLSPGDNIQQRVDANPEGTTFILRAGIHRLQQIRPKRGNSFIGENGAILNGSRLLSSFVMEGSLYVATNQTHKGFIHGHCKAGFPRCSHPNNLFINDQPLKHVDSLSQVVPGTFFFDYTNAKIYFADNPSGKKVETSVTSHAFQGTVHNVTIRNLIVEKYANPAQQGVIQSRIGADDTTFGHHWLVEENTVRLNHGAGIFLGSYGIMRNNKVIKNGQIGLRTRNGTNILIEGNEVAENNFAGFSWGWEAGGSKFGVTRDSIVRNNYSHNNDGPGLWTDWDNIRITYEHNLVEDNFAYGIFHEASHAATIRFNEVRNNGWGSKSWHGGVGILVADSANVEIYKNVVGGNHGGIAARQQTRGTHSTLGPRRVENLHVHNNIINMTVGNGITGVVRDNRLEDGTSDNRVYTEWNNRFDGNRYILRAPKSKSFAWSNGFRTFQQWQTFNHDLNGIVTYDLNKSN